MSLLSLDYKTSAPQYTKWTFNVSEDKDEIYVISASVGTATASIIISTTIEYEYLGGSNGGANTRAFMVWKLKNAKAGQSFTIQENHASITIWFVAQLG